MANVTVPTSPPGVWPAETAAIDETVYAQVEADVLRRKSGDLLEGIDARDAADMRERATHRAPKLTDAIDDAEATEADDDIAFTVKFTGDPAPEVHWYAKVGTGRREELTAGGDVAIATTSTQSVLTFDNVTLAQDGTVIDVVVRNYKGQVTSGPALLSVADAP